MQVEQAKIKTISAEEFFPIKVYALHGFQGIFAMAFGARNSDLLIPNRHCISQ